MKDLTGLPRPAGVLPLPPPAVPQPSTGTLFRQLADETVTLVRQEVALARSELYVKTQRWSWPASRFFKRVSWRCWPQ